MVDYRSNEPLPKALMCSICLAEPATVFAVSGGWYFGGIVCNQCFLDYMTFLSIPLKWPSLEPISMPHWRIAGD